MPPHSILIASELSKIRQVLIRIPGIANKPDDVRLTLALDPFGHEVLCLGFGAIETLD